MSDKPISVGDLVVIIRPTPCGCAYGVGKVRRVKAIDRSPFVNWCTYCGHRWGPEASAEFEEGYGASLSRLKRLDPDALNDDVPESEELTA